jgi:predicted nucleic acid-binding protein
MSGLTFDTNAYPAFCERTEAVCRILEQVATVLISPVVIGELAAGFRYGNRKQENMQRLQELLEDPRVQVPPVRESIAQRYGQIWADLRRRGRPIPTNDIWIAAQAIEADATLITYDRHFLEVPDLRVWPELESTG